jgi:hypothetical protein
VRLFCARAFFPLPFSQAKPSPRTAAPNVQARGRFKSEKGEDETKKKEDKEKEIKCSRKTAQEPLTPPSKRERERTNGPLSIALAHALPPSRRGHMCPRGFGHKAPCICPLRRQVVFLVHHLDVAVTLAPTEVRCEFLKTSFFVVAVFSVSMVQ